MSSKWLAVIIFTVLFGLASNVTRADPYQEELWNDPSAEENGENYWAYWDEAYNGPGELPEANYHHRPINWMNTGGVDNTGHVWTPLADLETEHDDNAYWPVYLTDQIADHYGVPHREIALTPNVDYIRLAVKEPALAPTPVDLKGAQLHFFVGQFWANDPDPDEWAFFYNANGFYDFNNTAWTTTLVPVGEGTTDWGVISMSSNPPITQASGLFSSPQQWGFVIFDPSATVLDPPEGELHFDNFGIVIPEPSSFPLAALGLLGLLAYAGRKRLAE